MAKKPGNKRGQPTKYDPKFCAELIAFFDIEPYREVEVTKFDKKGNEFSTTEERANDLPTLAGFCRKIGVHRDTLHEWSKVHKEFSDALKRAKDLQEYVLVTNGNKGLYAQPFAIFTAKNLLAWRDKVEHSSDPENPMRIINITRGT